MFTRHDQIKEELVNGGVLFSVKGHPNLNFRLSYDDVRYCVGRARRLLKCVDDMIVELPVEQWTRAEQLGSGEYPNKGIEFKISLIELKEMFIHQKK